MTHESGRDIETMLALLHHLGAPSDPPTASPGFVARTRAKSRAYWGDLQQLRANITSLEQQLARLTQENKDLTTKNSKYKVDLNWANAQFEKLQNEIAKEKAVRTAQQRAAAEAAATQQRAAASAAAAVMAEAEVQRQHKAEESIANQIQADKEISDRKARDEAARKAREEVRADRLRSETTAETEEREKRERVIAYNTYRHNPQSKP
jgi:hypothetical protein